MKGITHFAAGVAVASCFPQAVQAGTEGSPLYFILGGAAGLIADTLDFKFFRFVYRHDLEVIPDPLRPDPQMPHFQPSRLDQFRVRHQRAGRRQQDGGDEFAAAETRKFH